MLSRSVCVAKSQQSENKGTKHKPDARVAHKLLVWEAAVHLRSFKKIK